MRRVTAALVASWLVPAFVAAQQPNRRAQDSTTRTGAPADSQAGKTASGGALYQQSAEGRLAPGDSGTARTGELTANRGAIRGLSPSQVRKLQGALKSVGCYWGPASGKMDPQTSAAVACAHTRLAAPSYNVNEVLRQLNLGFVSSDSVVENQTQSGFVNTKTGRSTLGPHAKRVRPKGIKGAPVSDSAAMVDSTAKNQSESGVVNTETGKSTLGPGVTHERPTGIRGKVTADSTKAGRDTTRQPR
jgi:hypothetical protein